MSGVFNSQTHIEKAATYLSDYSTSDLTLNEYTCLLVSSKNNAEQLPNEQSEYYYWEHVFAKTKFGYVATVNGGKHHNCFYSEIDCAENISFIYCGHNSNKENGDHYRQEVYDLSLMFRGKNSINPDSINFMAVPQNRADELLIKRGENPDENGNFSTDQYEKLLGTSTQLSMDENIYNFTISNIILQEDGLYTKLAETFGEFVLSYTRFPDGFDKESAYVFNKYDYQNYHRLQRMRALFAGKNYELNIAKFNLTNKNTEIDNSVKDVVLSNQIGNNVLSALLVTFSLALYVICLYIFFLNSLSSKCFDYLLGGACLLSPYLVLFLINAFKHITSIFSHFSLTIILFSLVAFVFVIAISIFFKVKRIQVYE